MKVRMSCEAVRNIMKKSLLKLLSVFAVSAAFFSCRNGKNDSQFSKLDADRIQKSRVPLDLKLPTEEEIAVKPEYFSRNIIVSLKEHLSENEVNALAADFNLEVLYYYRNFNICSLSSKEKLDDLQMEALITSIEADERVNFAEGDGIIRLD